MPSSSFDKELILDNEKAISSLIDIIENSKPEKRIEKDLFSDENIRRGEEKVREILEKEKKKDML